MSSNTESSFYVVAGARRQKRPSIYRKRPSEYQKRPSDKRPSEYQKRPSTYQKRPSIYQKRPSTYKKRPHIKRDLVYVKRDLIAFSSKSQPEVCKEPREEDGEEEESAELCEKHNLIVV